VAQKNDSSTDSIVSSTNCRIPDPIYTPPTPSYQEIAQKAAHDDWWRAANQQHQQNQGTFSGKPY
jgi:hypothetical protein